jgi:hypothetical protein
MSYNKSDSEQQFLPETWYKKEDQGGMIFTETKNTFYKLY